MKSLKQYIGVKYIENHTNESILDDEDVLLDPERDKEIIRSWIEDNYEIVGRLKINDDYTVDCVGGVMLENEKATSLANGMFRWGKVDGDFFCSCPKLKTLEGGPEWVSGKFFCYKSRNLKSLKGAPKEVGGDFDCATCNKLESLEGGPEEVNGRFYCYNCRNLKTLKGSPKKVGGRFDCSGCGNLTSLEGAPEIVKRDFLCNDCENLRSFKGAPKEVGEYISCENCKNLKITDSDLKKYNIIS